jgi:acyl-CoA synthetase (AMP-forming)/AMP-acid ligase II
VTVAVGKRSPLDPKPADTATVFFATETLWPETQVRPNELGVDLRERQAPCRYRVYGSCVFNAAMMAGSTLIMIPRFNEVAMLREISEHRATLMDGVPTAYYYLLAHRDFDKYDLSSLTRCWVGGQTLPAAKSVEFTERTGCPVHEVWGMTELAGATSANPVIGPNKPGSIGIPTPATRCGSSMSSTPTRKWVWASAES